MVNDTIKITCSRCSKTQFIKSPTTIETSDEMYDAIQRAKWITVIMNGKTETFCSPECVKLYMDGIPSSDINIGKNCNIRSGTIIYPRVKIGDNFATGHYAVIREDTMIGDNCLIGTACVIEGNVVIGNNVRMQSQVYIPKYTIIGNNVFIGPNVVFTNDKYPPSADIIGSTIEDNVSIGANATIVPGISIGDHSLIAAGAVVTHDVPPHTIAKGNPARFTRKRFG